MQKNLEKLSSGLRINRAGDDAAGLSVSEKMRANITEADRCMNNVQEGLDLTRTADGALAEINDMLCRAKELCVEAANGTYGETERALVSQEMNELFDEIDRITEGSFHNTIQLFRGGRKGTGAETPEEPPADVKPPETEKPSGSSKPSGDGSWGQIEFIKDEPFDPAAPPAQAASVTFELAAGIDVNDVKTLAGKSIQIGTNVYYFTEDAYRTYTPYTNIEDNIINIISLEADDTFDSVMQKVVDRCGDVASYTLNRTDRTLTLTAVIDDLVDTVKADGKDNDYFVRAGDGEKKNGLVVRTPTYGTAADGKLLGQVDSGGADNNKPQRTTKSDMKFDLDLKGSLTGEDVEKLERNTIYMTLGDTQIALDLKGLFQENMTEEEVGNLLAQKFAEAVGSNDATKNDYKCEAKYNPATGKVDIGIESPTGKPVSSSFQEYSPPAETITEDNWTAKALDITVTETQYGVEQGYTVDLNPKYGNVREPFAFFVGAGSSKKYFLFHDSSTHPYIKPGFQDSQTTPYISPGDIIDVAGKTDDEIKELVAQKIVEYGKTLSYVKDATIHADKSVTFSVIVGGYEHPTAGGAEFKVTSSKPGSTSPSGTGNVFGGGIAYSKQRVSVSFSLGKDVKALAGKGFFVDGNAQFWMSSNGDKGRIEFVNGAGTGLHEKYRDVDISKCATFEDVRKMVEDTLNAGLGTDDEPYEVEMKQDGAGDSIMTISVAASSGLVMSVTDGEQGLIEGGTAKFSGGTQVGYSQKALDFSSITDDNLDSLAGSGFRIHCATCEGEYINVYFCQTENDPLPPEFGVESPKVHNVLVELSKITDAGNLVTEIVNQITPKLNHYTEVLVGKPPTTLIARDKRKGDYVVDGKLYRGRISTGVKGAEPEAPGPDAPPEEKPPAEPVPPEPPAPEPPKPPVEEESGRDIKIYVGSYAEDPFIHIHLPYIDLEWLGLAPPRVVDLNEQDPLALMEKVDGANVTISDVRGTIGAEYNRLEHAWQNLSQTKIQLTDAESRIRDADVAQLLMEDAKLQILGQSQQSMMAQANSMAQQALQLIV